MSLDPSLVIRKAVLKDALKISNLLKEYAAKGLLLSRNEPEVSERIREFSVCEINGEIVGTVALAFFWEKLAEVRSLCVAEGFKKRGIGRKLVECAIDEARDYGCQTIFALTYEQAFFEKVGFAVTDKHHFSQKVWVECTRCQKFPDCDEIAMSRTL